LERSLAGMPVTFTGYLRGEALAEVYASADVFAFPSCTETFGQVVQEAMASGLPVVAFATEGVRDLLQNGDTGVLVPAGDTAGFREALHKLATAPELRYTMGQRAQRRMQERTWSCVMDGLMTRYEQAHEKA